MPEPQIPSTVLKTGTSYNELLEGAKNVLKDAWQTTLFMEALRNLNWSRNYLWYCELDGVPSPFQRGGVLGLPCKSIQFQLAQGSSYDWVSGVTPLSAPQKINGLTSVTLDVLDDEKGTLMEFFERWYNNVYNPYFGVLPLNEACKCLTIYRQKSTRRNVKRLYYDIDRSVNSVASVISPQQNLGGLLNFFGLNTQRETQGIDFLVYPDDTVQMNYSYDSGDPISFTISLKVALFSNQDFGNPAEHTGYGSFSATQNNENDGIGWLSKISDYI